jgi:hypothetical protein
LNKIALSTVSELVQVSGDGPEDAVLAAGAGGHGIVGQDDAGPQVGVLVSMEVVCGLLCSMAVEHIITGKKTGGTALPGTWAMAANAFFSLEVHTWLEDRTLHDELDGYRDYARRARCPSCIPGTASAVTIQSMVTRLAGEG